MQIFKEQENVVLCRKIALESNIPNAERKGSRFFNLVLIGNIPIHYIFIKTLPALSAVSSVGKQIEIRTVFPGIPVYIGIPPWVTGNFLHEVRLQGGQTLLCGWIFVIIQAILLQGAFKIPDLGLCGDVCVL